MAPVLGVAFAAACAGGGAEPKPVASVASSTQAAIAFDKIRVDWSSQNEDDRLRARREIEAFLIAFKTDGLVTLASIHLALAFMEPPEDWQRADKIMTELREPQHGTTHDLWLIARARQLRRAHQAEAAFDVLRPLVGKMVDATTRGLLEEEVTLDAIEARHDYEAIAYMDAWLRGASEEDHEAVRAKVRRVLAGLPLPTLEGSLRAMRVQGAAQGYGTEIQRLVADRIAEVAVEKGDPSLARWLLDPDAGAAMIGGDAGVALGELATSKRGIGSVVGRTIGMLLPTGSPDLRDEAADVARGAAFALDLPRADPTADDATRLVTRDDGGDPARMEAGFEELAGEGASVVITALEGAAADMAIAWAETRQISVIVLAVPSKKAGAFAFVAGEATTRQLDALRGALDRQPGTGGTERGRNVIAAVAEEDALYVLAQRFNPANDPSMLAPVACDVPTTRAGDPRFPVAMWERLGVRTWLIGASADCARDLFHDLGARARGALFAVSLEGAATADRPVGGRFLALSAGVMPTSGTKASDPRQAEVAALASRFGGRPNWWTALGRDAAMLARKAFLAVPTDTVTGTAEIAARHRSVRDALASEHVRLWTTDDEGFDSGHSLPRTLRTVELPSSRDK